MSLLATLRKRQAERVATATPATFATHGRSNGPTVATVATVAVANNVKDAALADPWRELEALLAIVAPAYNVPDHEYPVLLATARGDLANALVYYRSEAKRIEANR